MQVVAFAVFFSLYSAAVVCAASYGSVFDTATRSVGEIIADLQQQLFDIKQQRRILYEQEKLVQLRLDRIFEANYRRPERAPTPPLPRPPPDIPLPPLPTHRPEVYNMQKARTSQITLKEKKKWPFGNFRSRNNIEK